MINISEQIRDLKCLQKNMKLEHRLGIVKCDISWIEYQIKIMDNVIDTIKTLSAKIPASNYSNNSDGWIPCSDKTPEDFKEYSNKKVIDVLVTTSAGRVTKVQRIHTTYNGKDHWYWGRIRGEATAWQPLPKAYKRNY